jgi:hypothetical protein
MSDTQNPGMLAKLIANNQITPEQGERLILTMLHDAAKEARTPRAHEWVSNAGYVTSNGRIYIGVGTLNDLDRAAENLSGSFIAHYEPGEASPITTQVRAAMLDELAQLCEKIVSVFAVPGGDTKRMPDLDELYNRILESADAKMGCDRDAKQSQHVA